VNWLSWLRRPVTIWALAGLSVLLAVSLIPLSLAARQNPLATSGPPDIVVCLSFAVVGLVVAWYRPGNPIGWLMLVLSVSILFYIDAGFYDVIGYRSGHRLPFAPVVLFLYQIQQPVLGLLPLVILLFPDGRLPSPRRHRRPSASSCCGYSRSATRW
jgi:two-component system, NarL family, sensor kinase